MPQRPKPLQYLLIRLFTSNEFLAEHITNLEYPQAFMLVAQLPGPAVSRLQYALAVTQQLQAHGLDDDALFEGLAERFPAQTALIEETRALYVADDEASAVISRPAPEPVEKEIPDETLRSFERVLGDRPTFLDVSYLGTGYRRAQAVAKLRMTFSDGIYVGTAFLIKPALLLTAQHNLWTDTGERASAVEVIFDFERAAGLAQREPRVVTSDLDGARGETDDDWAVLPLPAPEADRELAPLAADPVAVGDRVAIIQHPDGMVKQVALHNNMVTSVSDRRLQYLTDTLGGSSGAPVFDGTWSVVAVHQNGVEYKRALRPSVTRNEGTPIARIRARAAALGIKI